MPPKIATALSCGLLLLVAACAAAPEGARERVRADPDRRGPHAADFSPGSPVSRGYGP